MADGVQITAGSGTTIATDDCTGSTYSGQVQIVKLAVASDANSGLIPADLGYGMDVDVTRVAGTVLIGGAAAHDATDSGNPVKTGARAVTSVYSQTIVTANDRTDCFSGVDGVPINRPYCSIGDTISFRDTSTVATERILTPFAATASVKNCVTSVVAFNTSTTVSTFLNLLDGTGGTVILSLPLPAGGGCAINFPLPLLQPTAGNALYWIVSAAATTAYITVIGFRTKAY